MKIEIFGKDVHNVMDFHQQLNKCAKYPYYGYSIPALHDLLLNLLERPVHLVWHNSEISKQVLGEEIYQSIIDIFEEARIYDEDLCQRLPQYHSPDEKFTYELR